jgi:diguanylate cyclase (GGDEF)-like protein
MSARLSIDSIAGKIVVVVGVPVLAITLAAMGLAYRRAQEIIRHRAVDEAAAIAELIAASFPIVEEASQAAVGPSRPPLAHHLTISAMHGDFQILEDVGALRVIGRDGVIRWSRKVEEQGERLPGAAQLLSAPARGRAEEAAGEYVRALGGLACARCHTAGDPFMLGVVQVVVPRSAAAGEVGGLVRSLLVYAGIMMAALVAASIFAVRKIVTAPLTNLIKAMQRAEDGDVVVRARAVSHDEIGRLTTAFNSMVSKMTDLKVTEIETSREMEALQREVNLKAELERQHEVIEETNRALSRRVRDVTLLLDIDRSLNSTLELKEILGLVTEMVGVTLGVDQFAVMLLDEKTQLLRVAASFGFTGEVEYTIPLGQGASGIAAQTREPIYLTDLKADPRHVKGPQDPEGDGSLLCVPMVCKERLVGVLNFTRLQKAAFSENDAMLLQLVASKAAMAIVNAQLFSQAVELTLTDALTGAFNRRHLMARLEMEIARAHRFGTHLSAAMIDIDHFKHLNDACGHPAGDEILRELSALFRKSVRQVDTVARYGGEEFTVLLPSTPRAEALEVAEKLRRAIERTRFTGGERQPGGRMTISLGVATYPDDANDLAALIDAADAALYASKRLGRNRVTLYEKGMEVHPGHERAKAAPEPKSTANPGEVAGRRP